MGVYKEEAVPSTAFTLGFTCLREGDVEKAIKNLKLTANAHRGTSKAGLANFMLGQIFQNQASVKDPVLAEKVFRNAAILGADDGFYEPKKGEMLDLQHFQYWD